MAAARTRLGLVGASGYGGTEFLRLVAAHPTIEVAVVAAASRAGERVSDVAPNLLDDRVLEPVDPDRLTGLDVVVLATPHGPSLELAPLLLAAGVRVVDLSGAFRLGATDFGAWYGEPHPAPELAADGASAAVYGLTEWNRPAIADAALVANPGCYPTASLLALAPLAGLVEPGSVVIDAMSGTSGAGRSASDHLSASSVGGDVVAYGAPTHRHTIEIEHGLATLARSLGPVGFTPHLVPMPRGLLATVSARLSPGVGADEVRAALVERYADEPFVAVVAPGTFPHTKALTGSNGCRIGAVVDERTGRVVVSSAIDNLGKGAAGQALQNLNLMLGLAETTALTAIGVHP
jgi:N-acetyl-gamma-glutamyl-phosphate reductase